ncbi:MAG: DUF4412 domain-containing protein, partial [Bacteroidota bacterium]
LLLGIFLFVQFDASAQINRLKRKLEDRLAKKAADKIEEKIDERIAEEEAKNGKDKSKKKRRSIFDMGDIGAMSTEKPEDLEESYAFNFQVDWVINSSDSEDPVDMTQLYSTEKNYIGMTMKQAEGKKKKDNMEEFNSVLDVDKSYYVMMMPEDKQAMLFNFQNFEEQIIREIEKQEEETGETPKLKITKTSDTKNIAGYPCVKYVYESEEGSGEYWVTDEIKYESFNMFNYFKRISQRTGASQSKDYQMAMKGFVMEVKSVDNNGTETEMVVTNVDEKANVKMTLEGYSFMDMRAMQSRWTKEEE